MPADALAVAGNVTAVNATAAGDLRVFAAGIAAPATSNLNFAAGQVRANNLIVSLAGNPAGSLAVLLDSSGTSDFILDVNGYFK